MHVAFNLPIADVDKARAVGRRYAELYDKLWDEDEAMMVQRQAVLSAPRKKRKRQPVSLGTIAEVLASLPLSVEIGGETFRVLEVEGRLLAHSVLCPHMQGPLDTEPLQGLEVACPWHGYRFDLATGKSCDGRKLRLRPAPNVVICQGKDEIRLEWPAAPAR